jgi:hypothetical protein
MSMLPRIVRIAGPASDVTPSDEADSDAEESGAVARTRCHAASTGAMGTNAGARVASSERKYQPCKQVSEEMERIMVCVCMCVCVCVCVW